MRVFESHVAESPQNAVLTLKMAGRGSCETGASFKMGGSLKMGKAPSDWEGEAPAEPCLLAAS